MVSARAKYRNFQMPKVEMMLDKILCQSVKQRLIRGRIRGRKVVNRLDQSGAEIVRPDAIDEGAGEIGIVRSEQPIT